MHQGYCEVGDESYLIVCIIVPSDRQKTIIQGFIQGFGFREMWSAEWLFVALWLGLVNRDS